MYIHTCAGMSSIFFRRSQYILRPHFATPQFHSQSATTYINVASLREPRNVGNQGNQIEHIFGACLHANESPWFSYIDKVRHTLSAELYYYIFWVAHFFSPTYFLCHIFWRLIFFSKTCFPRKIARDKSYRFSKVQVRKVGKSNPEKNCDPNGKFERKWLSKYERWFAPIGKALKQGCQIFLGTN
jgi:hypothetical protein